MDKGRYKSEAPRPRGPEDQKENRKEIGGRKVTGLLVLKANRFGWQVRETPSGLRSLLIGYQVRVIRFGYGCGT